MYFKWGWQESLKCDVFGMLYFNPLNAELNLISHLLAY